MGSKTIHTEAPASETHAGAVPDLEGDDMMDKQDGSDDFDEDDNEMDSDVEYDMEEDLELSDHHDDDIDEW